MSAYDNELAAATAYIEKLKPGLLGTLDRTASAEQLKLYWNPALASDHLHGHNPDGIITRGAGEWTDGQLVLLSSLQRGLTDGPWKLQASPAKSGSALLYAKTDRIEAAVKATSTRKGTQLAWVSGTGQGSGLVEGLMAPHPVPATGLLNAMFLGAALRASELGALRAEWGGDAEGFTFDTWHTIRCLWGLGRAIAEPDALDELAGAAGLTVERTQEVLDGIVKDAAAAGYRQSRASEKTQLANFVPKSPARPSGEAEEADEPSNPFAVVGSGAGVLSVSGERFKEMFSDGIPSDPAEMAERFQQEADRQAGRGPAAAVTYTDEDVAGVFPAAALTVPGFDALNARQKALVGILGLELGDEAPGTYRLTRDWDALVLSRDGSADREVTLTPGGVAEFSIRPGAAPDAWLEAVGCLPIHSRGPGQLRTRPFAELLAEQDSLVILARAFADSALDDLPKGTLWCPPGQAMYENPDGGRFTAFRSGTVFVMEETSDGEDQITHIGGVPVTAILAAVYAQAEALGADLSRDCAATGLYHLLGKDLRQEDAAQEDEDA